MTNRAERFTFSGQGTIYSYTTVYEAPHGFTGQAPYTEALVDLDEGVRVTAQLTDVDRAVLDSQGNLYRMFEPNIPNAVLAQGIRCLIDVNGNPVNIGTRVEAVVRKISEDGERGQITYGYKFRPILDRS